MNSLERHLARMFRLEPRRRRPTTRYAKTQLLASEAREANALGVKVGTIREGRERGMIALHIGASGPLMGATTSRGGVTDLLRAYRKAQEA